MTCICSWFGLWWRSLVLTFDCSDMCLLMTMWFRVSDWEVAEGCSLSLSLRHLWFDILSWHPPSFRLQLFTPVLEQCRQFSKGSILWQFSVIFQIPICQGWNSLLRKKVDAKSLLFITWIFPPLLELLWEPKSQSEAAHGQLQNGQPSSLTDSHWLPAHSKYFPESESQTLHDRQRQYERKPIIYFR